MSEKLTTVNPLTEETIRDYNEMSVKEAGEIIDKTHNAYLDWRKSSFEVRAALFYKLADLLEERKDSLADLMTEEMGKVHTQGTAEVVKCAWACRYYADNAAKFLADEPVETDLDVSFVSYQPIGVILAIMPWNFPFWQVIRFAAPTLMAGNAAVLKHATATTGCALAIEKLFTDAGFPDNLFRTLLVSGKHASNLISHEKIRAVTLTGSTDAGKKVAERAGACIKKTVLELGGSDAYLILEDADIKNAAKICAQGRLQNAGQSCIAAKRFVVVDAVYDDFLAAFKEAMERAVMGNPKDASTDLGPMSSISARDFLHEQVQKTIKAGAECILGGEIPDKKGAWYPPTILADVKEHMPAYYEELFGPVAIVIRAKDDEDAISIANDSEFGLGGGVFTKNVERGIAMARDALDTGSIAVNDFVKSNPHLPFGGVKSSGYGRELSAFGIREFVNIKTITAKRGN